MGLFKKLAGDTEEFAFLIGLDRDPDAGAGAAEEEALSWGSFQIWVGGRNLCAHWEDGEVVDAVHWYMLPLLEWLAGSWDFLLHEERLPLRRGASDAAAFIEEAWSNDLEPDAEERLYEWQSRHCLTTCRDGGIFPNLTFRRRGDRVEVSSQNLAVAGAPKHVQFLNERICRYAEPSLVARALYEVITDAVRFLQDGLPGSERLKALASNVRNIRHAAPGKRLALLAGLGRTLESATDLWGRISQRIRQTGSPEAAEAVLASRVENDLVVSGSCQASLMFGSVSPTIGIEDAFLLADRLVGCYSPSGACDVLRRAVQSKPPAPHERPWQEGRELAEQFLEAMSVPNGEDERVDVESLLTRLGIRIEEIDLRDRGIRAVAIAGPKHEPTILVNRGHQTNRYPTGRRFTLAHELCHILHDGSHNESLAMASGPWAPSQVEQRANAFAAMLLMPPSLIQRAVRSRRLRLDTVEGIVELTQVLHASFTATVRHLRNLGWLDEDAMETLLDQAVDARAEGRL
jgi:Zn-dependent peptidase ImmA (M78 family)